VRLDSRVGKEAGIGRKAARDAILAGRVTVDGQICRVWTRDLDRFRRVDMDGRALGEPEPELYFMVHKPVGVVSATRDASATTVVDLVDHPQKHRLHVAGRLDRSSTGLVLLTNNGNWSKPLMNGSGKVEKSYRVETDIEIPDGAEDAFLEGFWFASEGIHTRPAKLTRLGPRLAEVTLTEGRYHQIKRMFHRLGCRLTSLHRFRVGNIELDPGLGLGQARALETNEIRAALAGTRGAL
jgi:16S rRNA pseudouridine516 synthase